LRIDNADERLTPVGRKFGLVSNERWNIFQAKEAQKQKLRALFQAKPHHAALLRRPETRIEDLDLGGEFARDALTTIETEVKYAGYIAQQDRQVLQLREAERRGIPPAFRYSDIPGLSSEVREKLERVRPHTLGQAGKIPGVTPAAVAVLDVYLSINRQHGRI
jgi:tRNA uridine 5-carboxymethylaminomethyl modification enzyme